MYLVLIRVVVIRRRECGLLIFVVYLILICVIVVNIVESALVSF